MEWRDIRQMIPMTKGGAEQVRGSGVRLVGDQAGKARRGLYSSTIWPEAGQTWQLRPVYCPKGRPPRPKVTISALREQPGT